MHTENKSIHSSEVIFTHKTTALLSQTPPDTDRSIDERHKPDRRPMVIIPAGLPNVIRGQYRNLILLRTPFRHFRQDTLHSANAENRITIKKNLLHHSSASLNDNSLRTKNLGISLRIKFRYPASIHFKPCPVKKATHRSF